MYRRRFAVSALAVLALVFPLSVQATAQEAGASLVPGGSPVDEADSWNLQYEAGQSGLAAWPAGACYGSFFAPLPATNAFEWGAVQSCTTVVPQQVSVQIDSCEQVGGGGEFSCVPYVARAGNLVVATQLRTSMLVPCTPGVSEYYRPSAYYIYVNGIEYPPVTGNMQLIPC